MVGDNSVVVRRFDDRNHVCPSEELAAVKNKDTRQFEGKWMEIEKKSF